MSELDPLRVHYADADDARRIATLHADSWRRHYRGAYSDAFLDGDVDADRFAVWAERLRTQNGSTATILAESDGVLVGFIHVVFEDHPTWGALIDNLHVTSARKRAGIGTRLMAEAAEAVTARGPGGLYLWVLEQNVEGRAFYEARGGRCVERCPVSPPGGVAGRITGSPEKLRYVWPDPRVLLEPLLSTP